MKRRTSVVYGLLLAVAVLGLFAVQPCLASHPSETAPVGATFPPDIQSYGDTGQGILARLQHRIEANPFNLVGTVIFLLAIIHTFVSGKFRALSHRLEKAHKTRIEAGAVPLRSVSHPSRFLHFMGEVEVVFGLWCIPLLLTIVAFYDWPTAVNYASHTVNFTEPIFVMVIMTLASTRPILKLSEAVMRCIARLFGGSLTAWWLTILTVGPLLGSFITEPAAMTISALLLVRKFYDWTRVPGSSTAPWASCSSTFRSAAP